eukprot:2869217-Rhodomonas_salina.1
MTSTIHQDIFLCVLYNKDEEALRKLLRGFVGEVGREHDTKDHALLLEKMPLVGLRAMFLLFVVISPNLRYWSMQYETRAIAKPNPEKVCLFLRTLRDDIIPKWMSDERKFAYDLVREATVTYIRC